MLIIEGIREFGKSYRARAATVVGARAATSTVVGSLDSWLPSRTPRLIFQQTATGGDDGKAAGGES